MKKEWLVKTLTMGIVVLFICISVTPSIGISNYLDDTIPPVTTISFNPPEPDGENGWYVSNVTVTLNATDDQSGVNITYYKINNGSWETYNLPFILWESNYYTIEFYSIDYAGNVENVQSANCKVDEIPPNTIVIYHGAVWGENGWLKELEYLELMATDDMSGVAVIRYCIGSGSWNIYTGGGIKFEDESPAALRYQAYDLAGNKEPIQEVIIKVDGTPPEILLTKEKIGIIKWKFNADVFDEISGINRVVFYLNDQIASVVSAPGPYELIQSGNYTVQAFAYDNAGNSAKSSIVFPKIPQNQNQPYLYRLFSRIFKQIQQKLPSLFKELILKYLI
jgi:cytochrome c